MLIYLHGGNQTIGFAKWVKDLVPAMITDPVNLFTFGVGGRGC